MTEDESPGNERRRNKGPEMSKWADDRIQRFVPRHAKMIKETLNTETPDFNKIEKAFQKLNDEIRRANVRNNVTRDQNTVRSNFYRWNFGTFVETQNNDLYKNNPTKQWEAFDAMHNLFRQFNRENHFPDDWTIPWSLADKVLGPRPSGMKQPSYDDDDDADSAVSYVSDEESDTEHEEGINALETRMRKDFTSLSHGKVLYWWSLGTGTQIFVRYGSKKTPIYRVQAGSSMPWDPRSVEQVLTQTPGTAKHIDTIDGKKVESYQKSRQDVRDIIGVGWKVEGDDEDGGSSLALIQPVKGAVYPHTRAIIKWTSGNVSLERRGFVRRIANGGTLAGDRLLYTKAKELESAYWGYDVGTVDEKSDAESSESDDSSSDESDHRQTRSRRAKKHEERKKRKERGKHKDRARSKKRDTETDESEDSDIEVEKRKTQAKWLARRKSKPPKFEPDTDEDIRNLEKKLRRMKLKKRRGM
ncbi:uncharacterized protein BDV17DRAFT_299030 [Aspergillus undulatus]|uniref:uncharacterized protein n=1 Tax=Aspergillus undulatus TaxID=1810928 RepID=UPI003CCCF22C